MHPQDRAVVHRRCARFTHLKLINVAIVPPVRVIAVATVLLKRRAQSHPCRVAWLRSRWTLYPVWQPWLLGLRRDPGLNEASGRTNIWNQQRKKRCLASGLVERVINRPHGTQGFGGRMLLSDGFMLVAWPVVWQRLRWSCPVVLIPVA